MDKKKGQMDNREGRGEKRTGISVEGYLMRDEVQRVRGKRSGVGHLG